MPICRIDNLLHIIDHSLSKKEYKMSTLLTQNSLFSLTAPFHNCLISEGEYMPTC